MGQEVAADGGNLDGLRPAALECRTLSTEVSRHTDRRVMFASVAGGIALVRLAFCTLASAETTDVLRNLGYGMSFWTHGFRVFDLTPPQLAVPGTWENLWPTHGYDYPFVPLLFFALLSKISTGVIFAKVVLTAIEGLNAVLIARLSGSPLIGLLFFASPASLWWVSGEGQFEPLVLLLALVAIERLRAGDLTVAYVALALSIQAKLFPIFLLPAFLARRRSPAALTAFVLAFAPSVLALTQSRYILPLFEAGYSPTGYNPFDWNVLSREPFDWMPTFLIVWCAVYSYGLLLAGIALAVRAWRRHGIAVVMSYLPLIGFLVFVKSLGWGQFWYVLLLPAMVLIIDEREERRPLLLLSLLEGRATSALLVGPVGFGQWFPMERYLRSWR